MKNTTDYQSAAKEIESLESVIPKQLVEGTNRALSKLSDALGGDVSGYVANRLHMDMDELRDALAAEQVDGVALAMYNIEKRSQALIIGDQTGIGKGRQAAAMIRYGLLAGYLPIFFTDRYTLFSDMYRDCKALGIKNARPLVVNAGVSVFDFDHIIDKKNKDDKDEIWLSSIGDDEEFDIELTELYKQQYEVVYKAPSQKVLQKLFMSGDIPSNTFEYLMITYSQLKDAKRDATRLDFLQSLCEKHRVLFIFDEAHRGSSVSAGKASVITAGISHILKETPQTQCVFLSATFAKRPESFITFAHRTVLSALATENTLQNALHSGGVPMQEYVSSCLTAEGQMLRREHSSEGIPTPVYTYLDDDIVMHSELFDKVMLYFREVVKLSSMINELVAVAKTQKLLEDYKCYPARAQLFYVNKVLLLALKAQKIAQVAIDEVQQGKCIVIGMSDTLECVLRDVIVGEDGMARGDISTLLLRLLERAIRCSGVNIEQGNTIFDQLQELPSESIIALQTQIDEARNYYKFLIQSIKDDVFHVPMSPIDVIRQLITQEKFIAPNGDYINIRFEECTGRAHQLEYLSPEGHDDFVSAQIQPRKKRHSNYIFNDFQNNKLDVILINACGSTGASAHAIATAEVLDKEVRQRKMLIVQNDLDVNIDLQKRGRINRTGQRVDLPPLYEYIITAIPSEKRLNMMLRAKLRSLSANTAAWQDQNKDQADFLDISNKYGNEVADDYMKEHPELAEVLNLKSSITASKLLARIAMLSVSAQQEIVDDLESAYTTLESELRRINQWDLEREFRDFEAEFVREELFTTTSAKSKLGGSSYLSTYKCKQKTFPYSYDKLIDLCEKNNAKYGKPYKENKALQQQIKDYYQNRNKQIRNNFAERRKLLFVDNKRVIVNYCHNEELANKWLKKAELPIPSWPNSYFEGLDSGNPLVEKLKFYLKDSNALQEKEKQLIKRKLVSYSNEYNHLLERENKELKKYQDEKKRLIEILLEATIGKWWKDISEQISSDECPSKVTAVLFDIRFGFEEKNKFLPSKVELVFALSGVYTELHINLVHNKKWSNYKRLVEILRSYSSMGSGTIKREYWEKEIASNNSKIVERKIITGNILGAYVHPAIATLQPRFITFSLKANEQGEVNTQQGLLLPMDESKIREAIKTVSIPLHEGIQYANSTSTSYTIAGLGVNFSLLPYRMNDDNVCFVISVLDQLSKVFEEDKRFDNIRSFFKGVPISSIYEKDDSSSSKKRKSLMHYSTEHLEFESETLQTIIQTLAQLGAVIIVPRDQITYGEAKEFASRSFRDDTKPWEVLDWKDKDAVPIPPLKENLLFCISAPIVQRQNGKLVREHSEYYLLTKETSELVGSPLDKISTREALRRNYMKWKNFYETQIKQSYNQEIEQKLFLSKNICHELHLIMENKAKAQEVTFNQNLQDEIQKVLDSEYLDTSSLYLNKFNDEMLFYSPEIAEAQAFLDNMPCSPSLDTIRKCVQDYIDGKTDIINPPTNMVI